MIAAGARTFVMGDAEHRQQVAALILRAPAGWEVTVRPPFRTLAQNRRFHAILSDIAAAGFSLDGRRLKSTEIKVAFVSGWMIEEGYGCDIIKGVQDEPVQLIRSTTTFGVDEMASLLDFTEVECARRNIPLRERGT